MGGVIMSKRVPPTLVIDPPEILYDSKIRNAGGNYIVTPVYTSDFMFYFQVPKATAVDSYYKPIEWEAKIFTGNNVDIYTGREDHILEIESDVDTQIHYTATDRWENTTRKIIKFNFFEPGSIPQPSARISNDSKFVNIQGEQVHIYPDHILGKGQNYYSKFFPENVNLNIDPTSEIPILKFSAVLDQGTQNKTSVRTLSLNAGPDVDYLSAGDSELIGTAPDSSIKGSYSQYLGMNEILGPFQDAGLVTDIYPNGYNIITWKVCVLDKQDWNNFINDRDDENTKSPEGTIRTKPLWK